MLHDCVLCHNSMYYQISLICFVKARKTLDKDSIKCHPRCWMEVDSLKVAAPDVSASGKANMLIVVDMNSSMQKMQEGARTGASDEQQDGSEKVKNDEKKKGKIFKRPLQKKETSAGGDGEKICIGKRGFEVVYMKEAEEVVMTKKGRLEMGGSEEVNNTINEAGLSGQPYETQ